MAGSSDNLGNAAAQGLAGPQASTTPSIPTDPGHATAGEKGKALKTIADLDLQLANEICKRLDGEKGGEWNFEIDSPGMTYIQDEYDFERKLKAYKNVQPETEASKAVDGSISQDHVRRTALAITNSPGLYPGEYKLQNAMTEINAWTQTDVVMMAWMVLTSVRKAQGINAGKAGRFRNWNERLEMVIDFLKIAKTQVVPLRLEFEEYANGLAIDIVKRRNAFVLQRETKQLRREHRPRKRASSDQIATGASSPMPSSDVTPDVGAKKKQKLDSEDVDDPASPSDCA